MEATRESLAGKLGEVESLVRETVQVASDTVTSTVDDVKGVVESVTDTVSSTVSSVKETFNLRKQVEEHPWTAVGAAFGLGMAGGILLGPSSSSSTTAAAPSQPFSSASSAPSRSQEPGVMSSLFQNLQGMAIGALVGVARDFINESAPEQWREGLSKTLDDLTFQLTGEKPSTTQQGSLFSPKAHEEDHGSDAGWSGSQGNGSRVRSA